MSLAATTIPLVLNQFSAEEANDGSVWSSEWWQWTVCVCFSLLSIYEIQEVCFARIEKKAGEAHEGFWEGDGSYYFKCILTTIFTVAEFREACGIIWVTAAGSGEEMEPKDVAKALSGAEKEKAETDETDASMSFLKKGLNYGDYLINW